MTVSLDGTMAMLDPGRRHKIEERPWKLITEEMTLRELRKARELTQASVARESSELARTLPSHGWSSAATCCCPRCARRSRR